MPRQLIGLIFLCIASPAATAGIWTIVEFEKGASGDWERVGVGSLFLNSQVAPTLEIPWGSQRAYWMQLRTGFSDTLGDTVTVVQTITGVFEDDDVFLTGAFFDEDLAPSWAERLLWASPSTYVYVDPVEIRSYEHPDVALPNYSWTGHYWFVRPQTGKGYTSDFWLHAQHKAYDPDTSEYRAGDYGLVSFKVATGGSAVPPPAALMGLGLLALLGTARRLRRRRT